MSMNTSMNIGSTSNAGDNGAISEMNMTPLIDVLLVLIIMMVMTIPIQNHSVSLNMPGLDRWQGDPVVSTINVDFDGTVLWDGEVMPTRSALETKLKVVAADMPQNEVHLRSDKMVEYKHVAAVLASAQRLGVTNIGLTGNEQFIN